MDAIMRDTFKEVPMATDKVVHKLRCFDNSWMPCLQIDDAKHNAGSKTFLLGKKRICPSAA
jgi:hypothetical protein